MSRTTLSALTAGALALLSLGAMATRYLVLGDEVKLPVGPSVWKVTLALQGTCQANARLMSATPLDLDRQHVLKDVYHSAQLLNKPPEARHPERRLVYWSPKAGLPPGPFRARCEFQVGVEVSQAGGAARRPATGLYAPPAPGECLDFDSLAGTDSEQISVQARRLTAPLEQPNTMDVVEALYRFVEGEIENEPWSARAVVGAAECLKNRSGDCAAKSRLLVALLRNRDIPARIVTGVTLTRGHEQPPHYWVEAWVAERGTWLPLCPFWHHFGAVPRTYLVFGFGDQPLVRSRHVQDLDYGFLVERVRAEDTGAPPASLLHRAFTAVSLYRLPPAERRLVEVLLLLPVAALIICLFRNLVGLNSFGTFAPALIGLAFHELHSLPGILVFVAILLVGWVMRRVLDHYHLLQVPRVAVMLTLIMMVLIGAVVGSNYFGAATTTYISLFPLVILTGMVERFWTLEVEDSATASFQTLLHTMLISTLIALVLGLRALALFLFRYPETLGLIVAAQLLIGRYTGYRLTELLRFRDFLTRPPADRPPLAVVPTPD